MNTSEKLFMQWSHFQSYISQSFQDMRNGEELFDVTLACDDGKQLNAHKVILSACSPIFRQMLSKSKHPQPLIFMPGMRSKELISFTMVLIRITFLASSA